MAKKVTLVVTRWSFKAGKAVTAKTGGNNEEHTRVRDGPEKRSRQTVSTSKACSR